MIFVLRQIQEKCKEQNKDLYLAFVHLTKAFDTLSRDGQWKILAHPHHHHHHLSFKRQGRWGTTDDFTTSFLHFSLFSTALWDLMNSGPVHSLMLSSHLFFCLPCLRPLSLCLENWFCQDLMNGRRGHTTAVCVSLRRSGLRVVRMLAGLGTDFLVGNMVFVRGA